MMKNLIARMAMRALAAFFLCAAFVETRVLACPVCYGDNESAEVEGARWAIFFLLGVTGTVLSGVVAFVVHIRRRSRHAPVEAPSSH
jgi:heme/copper-type cytochrome/quinol oxidase subunit 2